MDNTVWLIDDDESIRESLAFLLSGMGWQVNGFESIDAFTSAHGGRAALVGCLLLDMRMPGKRRADLAGGGQMALAAAAGYRHDRTRHR